MACASLASGIFADLHARLPRSHRPIQTVQATSGPHVIGGVETVQKQMPQQLASATCAATTVGGVPETAGMGTKEVGLIALLEEAVPCTSRWAAPPVHCSTPAGEPPPPPATTPPTPATAEPTSSTATPLLVLLAATPLPAA